MEYSAGAAVFIPIFIILVMEEQYRRMETHRRILIKRKRMRGAIIMNEVVKTFIGKECIISTINANITGIIEAVDENWVSIRPRNKSCVELMNTDHISRIREHPRNKTAAN